jgi:peptide deformylase
VSTTFSWSSPHRSSPDYGFLAACLLHEIDQLDGIFWLERLSRLKRERIIKRFAKLQRATAS